MKLIDKTTYTNIQELKNKLVYFKIETKDLFIYNIVKIISIVSDKPLKYEIKNGYYFCVPKNNAIKCYNYQRSNIIEIPNKTIIYEMESKEYLETYMVFVKYEGKYPNELPSKLIQDIV